MSRFAVRATWPLLMALTLASGACRLVATSPSPPPLPGTTPPNSSVAGARDESSGTLEIAAIEALTLTDPARNKELPLRITYPATGGPFPVIVYSHGAFGSKDGYQPLIRHWVAAGYVCIQPTHEDSVAYGNRFGDARVFNKWETRPADIKLILDSLPQLAERPELAGKLDLARIGMGGHSFGAHTSQLVGGATVTIPGAARRSYADQRPLAILLISPQGVGQLLDPQSWSTLIRPTMVITGTKDTGQRGEPWEWRLHPYQNAPPGDKTLIVIENAQHNFGGISGVRASRLLGLGAPNAKHLATVQAASLAFWDLYLKQDASAAERISAARLTELAGDSVQVETK